MKAVVNERYGLPEVLEFREAEKPTPKDDEVLIKIHATSVNRTDCGLRKAEPFIVRFFMGFRRPKIKVLGSEFAGEVVDFGKEVRTFKKGDRVFGLSTKNYGCHAEYLCLPESGSFTTMPQDRSYEEVGAICEGPMLAMAYLRKMDLKSRPDLMIYGASGSIGTAAVQLAKYFGANITAVCNTKNLELVQSLRADEVLDYTKEDFTKIGRTYDYVFDAVGKSSFFKCKPLLKPGGIYFSTDLGFMAQNVFLPSWTSIFGNKRVMFPLPTDSKDDIFFFKKLLETGHYQPVIDRQYSLDQIVEAYKYVETEQKTGNVVITLNRG